MAVDQVSTRSIPALNASGTQDPAGLREGTILDGRIVAVNSDDTLRIATRSGMIDVDPAQISIAGESGRGKLPPLADLVGTAVKLEVTGQNSALSRYSVRLVSAGDPTAAPDTALTLPEGEIASRIAMEVAQAAARQEGLAQDFAGASQLAGASDGLPDAVSSALANLSGFALDGSAEITADDIRSAISSSGLFFEAKLAKLAAGVTDDSPLNLKSGLGLGMQDMKAALFGLKSALDQWIAEATAGAPVTETVIPGQAGPTGDTTSLAAAAAQLAETETEQPQGFDTEALFAVLRPPPVVTAATSQPASPFAQPGAALASQLMNQTVGRPDVVTLATIGEWFQASGQAPSGGGRRGAYGSNPAALDRPTREMPVPEGSASGRPPPPRRGSLPQGQPALSAESTERQPLDIARELALKTGNALARVSLGQYASLPEKASTLQSGSSPTAASKSPVSWLFEIPFTVGTGTSIAQFEIDQIFEGTAGEADYTRAWRVQFSLDVAPLGPVHARLVLADKKLSVGLWAEGRIAATGLQRGIAALRQSLEAAQFEVDEIHFAQGRPPSGPPVKAGGFIDRNA